MFKYGSFKLFLLKTLCGLFLIFLSAFLLISIFTYDYNDPGIGRLNQNTEIKNFFGFWGAMCSSILLLIFGTISALIVFFVFYIGLKITLGFKLKREFLKFLLTIFSSVLVNFVIIAQEIKFLETGILSAVLFDIFSSYFGYIFDSFLYNNLISFSLLFISFIIIIYNFSIKIFFLRNFFMKFFKLNFFIFLRLSNIIKIPSLKTVARPKFRSNKKNEPTFTKKTNFFEKPKGKNDKILENEFIFKLPESDFLIKSATKNSYKKEIENLNKANAIKLEKILEEYGVLGQIIGFKTGPIVTLYEFIPNAGIKASKVIGLSDDIARAMSSVSARISSQPGKTSLGIEIPNLKREDVMFGDLIQNQRFNNLNNNLTLALGKDISGHVVCADLEKMPHILIAGTTGSGKSVGINTIIMSILYRFKPDECKLILIDPKMLELSIYEDIPHLLTPVVTNPNKAVFALKWVVREMENRYKLMSSINVKNINTYNEKSKKILSTGKKLFKKVQTGIDNDTRQPIFERREIPLEKMPFIVVVIDEMADLMMVAGKEVENLVQRLAQMARASGIHLVTATQRPSVDVITGTIKANFPTRISFQVSSKIDSRTILGEQGAEQLLGKGDMLFMSSANKIVRIHGPYVSEKEIEKVNSFLRSQQDPDYVEEIMSFVNEKENLENFSDNENRDELFKTAVDLVKTERKASTSFLQRKLQIGYNRAARIIDMMEEDGIVSKANHVGKREVL